MNAGVFSTLLLLPLWLIPLGITIWLLMLANRAVKALESIAESLRNRGSE